MVQNILALAQRFDDRIDAVADNAEEMGPAPVDQRFDQNDVFASWPARTAGCVNIVGGLPL